MSNAILHPHLEHSVDTVYRVVLVSQPFDYLSIGITIGAAIAASAFAAYLTYRFQFRTQRRSDKLMLFGRLMAYQEYPAAFESVIAMNLIDATFEKEKQVVDAWHHLADLLEAPAADWEKKDDNGQTHAQLVRQSRRDMLQAMGKSLKYGSLDEKKWRSYAAMGLATDAEESAQVRKLWIRVLTQMLGPDAQKQEQPPDDPSNKSAL
jgi:hypothetical protein